MFTVLRRRNFALLWSAGLISALGDWLLQVALPYHVYALTGSALATGLSFILYNIPRLALSPLVGVLIDRWDRRRTLIAANLFSGAILLALLQVTSPQRLWIVYGTVLVQACVANIVQPATGAFLPLVVGEEELVAANALNAATYGVARLVGAALGGAMLGLVGFGTVVLADIASFLAAAVLLLPIAVGPGATPARMDRRRQENVPAALRAGLRLIWETRLLRVLLCVDGLVMVGYGIVTVLLVVFVRDVLRGGAPEFGWVATAQGLGTVLGTLAVGWLGQRLPPARLLCISLGAMGVGYVAAFQARHLAAMLPCVALAGMAVTGQAVSERTLVQRAVPNEYLGRVLSTTTTSNAAWILVGMGLASALAGAIGVVIVLNVAGALYLAAAVVAAAWLPAGDTEPGETAEMADEPLSD